MHLKGEGRSVLSDLIKELMKLKLQKKNIIGSKRKVSQIFTNGAANADPYPPLEALKLGK